MKRRKEERERGWKTLRSGKERRPRKSVRVKKEDNEFDKTNEKKEHKKADSEERQRGGGSRRLGWEARVSSVPYYYITSGTLPSCTLLFDKHKGPSSKSPTKTHRSLPILCQDCP